MSESQTIQIVRPEEAIGACFVIICVVFMLYGVFCAQVFFYWTSYKDHLVVRCIVGLLTILGSAHVALCIAMLYRYLIIDYANSDALLTILWSVGASILTEFLISGLVQGWYIYRIWRLTTSVLAILWTTRMGLALTYAANLTRSTTWLSSAEVFNARIILNCAFGMNVVVDLSITSILTFYLYHNHSLASRRSTKTLVSRLIGFSVGVGALNLIASITLIIFINTVADLTFVGLMNMEAKLYANSMLAMLNSRQRIAQQAVSSGNYTIELSQMQSRAATRHTAVIHVRQETVVSGDLWPSDSGSERPAMQLVLGPTSVRDQAQDIKQKQEV
ncbi:hypothetical protein BC835DRAFT_402409 [Cytidiella melzeri]|nr:hypothetical protein BC835DRAFT_402409 [Cytidiella melzeri]